MPDNELRGDQDPSGLDAGPVAAPPPVLSDLDRRRILHEWNDTGAEFPHACVHELFEKQVNRDPDALAVVFGSQRLTYRELNQRANQVAHLLLRRGVRPDTLVGVSLERSPELVVALLGVWKAGGAYVPLDPAYPQERLSFMVEDSGIRMLLTEQKCKDLFPSSREKVGLPFRFRLADRGAGVDRQSRFRSRPLQLGLRDVHLRLHGPPKGAISTYTAVW